MALNTNEDPVAALLRQMLADEEETEAHYADFRDSPGAPSNIFFVPTLPKNHPLYLRDHQSEVLEEGEEGLIYTPSRPALHLYDDKITLSEGDLNGP